MKIHKNRLYFHSISIIRNSPFSIDCPRYTRTAIATIAYVVNLYMVFPSSTYPAFTQPNSPAPSVMTKNRTRNENYIGDAKK